MLCGENVNRTQRKATQFNPVLRSGKRHANITSKSQHLIKWIPNNNWHCSVEASRALASSLTVPKLRVAQIFVIAFSAT